MLLTLRFLMIGGFNTKYVHLISVGVLNYTPQRKDGRLF